jgi:hypothetical protein
MKKTIGPESIVILTYKNTYAAAFNRQNRARSAIFRVTD